MSSQASTTTIPIKEDTADALYDEKRRGESWDDVLRRLTGLEREQVDD